MLYFSLLHFSELLQPQWYVENGGILLIMFIVFAETGLFAGFFLPGDSLLFVTGVYSNKLIHDILPNQDNYSGLMIVILLITFSGIAGNMFGYYFGKKSGTKLYNKKDTLFFKHKYLENTKLYFEKHGNITIFIARFIPFVRTFAPIVAGIVVMNFNKFMFYNIFGCLIWSVSLISSGYFLNDYLLTHYDIDVSSHLGYIVLAIVLLTTIPFLFKINQAGLNTSALKNWIKNWNKS